MWIWRGTSSAPYPSEHSPTARVGRKFPSMQIMPEITTDRPWRTSCEFLAAVRYRAEPTDPAALTQPLKCLKVGVYSWIKFRCTVRSLVALQCCCSRPKKHKFGVNSKVLWGLTETSPVFAKKFHLQLLEVPDEVLELFHTHFLLYLIILLY